MILRHGHLKMHNRASHGPAVSTELRKAEGEYAKLRTGETRMTKERTELKEKIERYKQDLERFAEAQSPDNEINVAVAVRRALAVRICGRRGLLPAYWHVDGAVPARDPTSAYLCTVLNSSPCRG